MRGEAFIYKVIVCMMAVGVMCLCNYIKESLKKYIKQHK